LALVAPFCSARAVSPIPLLSLPHTAIRDRRAAVFLEDFAGLEMHLMHFSGLMEKPGHKWHPECQLSAISERGSSCPTAFVARQKTNTGILRSAQNDNFEGSAAERRNSTGRAAVERSRAKKLAAIALPF
jgi:hypothetical protein